MKTTRLSHLLGVVLGLMLCSQATGEVVHAPIPADLGANKEPDVLAGGVCDDPDGRLMMQAAQRMIAAYHAGQPRTTNTLRVIYFVPKDGKVLPGYAERLDRAVNDVSDFYRDGLRRLGMETTGLPLERKDGKLVLHLVRGQLPASRYHYNSSTVPEIRLALKDTIDIDREYLLVFYALASRKTDGTYVFDAPYYGESGSSQRSGLCHAADCELLDPLLLTETNRTIVFTEHNYKNIKMTVAQFNSWYLGGVAHELGHALGLPHDDGGSFEKQFGTSLMGEGNLSYRQELWGGGNPQHHLGLWVGAAPTYLGRASALQLVSHPLFTGSDRGRWDTLKSDFQTLHFSVTNGMVRIQGVVTSTIPAYAVIAYVWPVDSKIDDHWARTFPCVLKNGAFTLDLEKIHADHWRHFRLKLATLHVNGGTTRRVFNLRYDGSLTPDATALNEEWIVNRWKRQ